MLAEIKSQMSIFPLMLNILVITTN